MPNYWILKTEPSTYSFASLVSRGTDVWDGVANPVALRNLRNMTPGDEVMIYHTGDQKAIVGLATVASDPRPDPKNPKLTVIDLTAGASIARPVTLAAIKADPAFAEMVLVKNSRLSVQPVRPEEWSLICKMGGYKG
jgi:predicted RNA-binding protein with PUA-like domain